VRAAFPRLHALEQAHGSLLLGLMRRARERKGGPAPRSFSFRGGMQTLIDALAARVDVVTSTRATLLPQHDGDHVVELAGPRSSARLRARSIVIATAADAAATLLRTVAPQAAQQLDAIAYAPVSIVVAAHRREDVAHPLDGFGFLVPSREQRPILGTLFSSTMFEGRAPAGHVLLTTFVGGQRNPRLAALDDAALCEVVTGELASLLGARAALWVDIVRWPRAIPQYTLGHEARVAAIDQATAHLPTLFLSANWRGGVSLADCIVRSQRTASSVRRALGAAASPA
jgi:oxygen-dependent protoporphyrinogen oxidase